jgi:hypothetical protein
MSVTEEEIRKWQTVSAGAKAHEHQGFRVTPDFFDRLIARVRELETELGDDYDLAAVTGLERDQWKEAAELAWMACRECGSPSSREAARLALDEARAMGLEQTTSNRKDRNDGELENS